MRDVGDPRPCRRLDLARRRSRNRRHVRRLVRGAPPGDEAPGGRSTGAGPRPRAARPRPCPHHVVSARAAGDHRRAAPARRLGSDASGVRASLRAMRAEIRWFQGRPREAVALAKLAIDDVGGSEEVEPLMALARAYTALDGSYRMLGQPELARHEPLALEIYERLGQLRLVGIQALNLGTSAYWYGRWDEAATCTGGRAMTRACRRPAERGRRGLQSRRAARRPRTTRRGRASAHRGTAYLAGSGCDSLGAVRRDAARAVCARAQRRRRSDASARSHHRGGTRCRLHRLGSRDDGLLRPGRGDGGTGRRGPGGARPAATAAGDEAALYAAPLERARSVCLRVLGRADESRAPAWTGRWRLPRRRASSTSSCSRAPRAPGSWQGSRKTRSCARFFASRSSSGSRLS